MTNPSAAHPSMRERALTWFLLPAIALAVLASGRAGAAENWPEMPKPPQSKSQWIADSMRVNGVPMRVLQFQSSASRQEVVDYYKARWTNGSALKPAINALDGATVIGQMQGPYLLNVKVRDGIKGGSTGLLSVSRILGSKPDFSPGDVPLSPGAMVKSVVESNDPGKHNREVVLQAPQSTASVMNFYGAALEAAGWHRIQSNEAARTPHSPAGGFAVYGRNASELQLGVTDQPNGMGSMVVVNTVTKGTYAGSF